MTDEAPYATPLTLLQDWAVQDSFETFREQMTGAMLFPKKAGLRKWAFARARDRFGNDGFYAEFGVWRGHGVNLFAKLAQGHGIEIWGFDSFEGLQEDWTGQARGAQTGRYSLDGQMPEVRPGVRLVKGLVQDTVADWLTSMGDARASFLHFDLDTYAPTHFVLEAIAPHLREGTILVFDELYGYPGWRHHEYKALCDVLPDERYAFIGFSEQAVALEICAA